MSFVLKQRKAGFATEFMSAYLGNNNIKRFICTHLYNCVVILFPLSENATFIEEFNLFHILLS